MKFKKYLFYLDVLILLSILIISSYFAIAADLEPIEDVREAQERIDRNFDVQPIKNDFVMNFGKDWMKIELLDYRSALIKDYDLQLFGAEEVDVSRNATSSNLDLRKISRKQVVDYGFDIDTKIYPNVKIRITTSKPMTINQHIASFLHSTETKSFDGFNEYEKKTFVQHDSDYLLKKNEQATFSFKQIKDNVYLIEMFGATDLDPSVYYVYDSYPSGEYNATEWDSVDEHLSLKKDATIVFKGNYNTTNNTELDLSAYHNHGEIDSYHISNIEDGHRAFELGKSGMGMNFDGVENRVEIPNGNVLQLNTSYSIQIWYNPRVYQNAYVLSKNDADEIGYNLYLEDDGDVTVIQGNGTALETFRTYNLNQWNLAFIAINSTGNGIYFYHNGIPGFFGKFSPMNITDSGIYLGNSNGTSIYYDGMIDNIKIWNCTMNSTSMDLEWGAAGSFPQCNNTPEGTMVGVWYFEGTNIRNITDDSGYNNHGTAIEYNRPAYVEDENCIFGGCYFLEGSQTDSSRMTVKNGVNYGYNYSMLFWVNNTEEDIGRTAIYIGHIDGVPYVGRVASKINLRYTGSLYYACPTVLNNSQMYHIAVTSSEFNSTHIQATVYIDGTNHGSGYIKHGGQQFYNISIGAFKDERYGFTGYMDEIFIFNRTLSADEISSYYNGVNKKQSMIPAYRTNGTYSNIIDSGETGTTWDNITITGGFDNDTSILRDFTATTYKEYWTFDNDTCGAVSGTCPLAPLFGTLPRYEVMYAAGINGSYYFDGQNDTMEFLGFGNVNGNISNGSSTTNAAWSVWTTSLLNSQKVNATVIGTSPVNYLLNASSNDFQCAVVDKDGIWVNTTPTNNLYKDEWHWHLCTVNTTHLIHYIDGIEFSNVSFSGTIYPVYSDMFLGSANDTGDFYNGLIDEFAIENRSYNPQEAIEKYRTYRGNKVSFKFATSNDSITYTEWFDNALPNLATGFVDINDSLTRGRYLKYEPVFETVDEEYTAEIESLDIGYNITPYGCDYFIYGCTNVANPDSTYCLMQDLTDVGLNCMLIDEYNVTLNCLGHYIDGDTSATGIYTTANQATIKNCNITEYTYMFRSENTVNTTVENNTFNIVAGDYGMRISGENFLIQNNTFTGAGFVMYNYGVSNSTVQYNNFSNIGAIKHVTSNSTNITYKNNYFYDVGTAFFTFNTVSAFNMTLIGNNFTKCAGTLIYGYTSLDGLTVRNNYFDSIEQVYIDSVDYETKDVLFENNTFSNFDNNPSFTIINAWNLTNFIFRNNTVRRNSTEQLMILYNVSDSVIEYNSFGTSDELINSINTPNSDILTAYGASNLTIRYNDIHCYYCGGMYITNEGGYVSDSKIQNNTFEATSENRGHIFGIGLEWSNEFNGINGLIEYNNITVYNPNETSSAHGIFLGHNNHSIARNNFVTGVSYAFVIKGNYNATIYDNDIYNATWASIYDRGGVDDYFYNNYIYQPSNYSFINALYLNSEGGYGNATNITFENMILDINATTTLPIKVEGNQSAVIINTTYTTVNESGNGNITRKWYHKVNVTLNNVPLSLTVKIFNGTLFNVVNQTSGIDGLSNNTLLDEYIYVTRTRTYINYTVSGEYNGDTQEEDINISNATGDLITLLNFALSSISGTGGGGGLSSPSITNISIGIIVEGLKRYYYVGEEINFKVYFNQSVEEINAIILSSDETKYAIKSEQIDNKTFALSFNTDILKEGTFEVLITSNKGGLYQKQIILEGNLFINSFKNIGEKLNLTVPQLIYVLIILILLTVIICYLFLLIFGGTKKK